MFADKERRAFRSYPEENDLTQDFRKLNVNDQKPKYSSSNASNSAVVPVGHKQVIRANGFITIN